MATGSSQSHQSSYYGDLDVDNSKGSNDSCEYQRTFLFVLDDIKHFHIGGHLIPANLNTSLEVQICVYAICTCIPSFFVSRLFIGYKGWKLLTAALLSPYRQLKCCKVILLLLYIISVILYCILSPGSQHRGHFAFSKMPKY